MSLKIKSNGEEVDGGRANFSFPAHEGQISKWQNAKFSKNNNNYNNNNP